MGRRFAAITSIGLLATACGSSVPSKPEPAPVAPSTAIVGATLWDGTGRPPVPNAVTVVRNDRILCAGTAGVTGRSQAADGATQGIHSI
jgi:hypothetical protein